MPFAREIILFILDFIRFRVPRTSEKDSYYTVLGNTLVRVSNHCTWLHIWDDMLEKNPKWKGMRIISIVFEDQNDTFNNNCLVLKRERRKPIRVEEYVYQLNGNAHYLSKDEIKAIINSIKLIERNNSFSDPTGKAIYCPRVSLNPSSANTTTDRNGNTTYSTNYGYGADYVSESIDNKQHKTRYNMKKTIKLSESDLHRIIKECVNHVLMESTDMSDIVTNDELHEGFGNWIRAGVDALSNTGAYTQGQSNSKLCNFVDNVRGRKQNYDDIDTMQKARKNGYQNAPQAQMAKARNMTYTAPGSNRQVSDTRRSQAYQTMRNAKETQQRVDRRRSTRDYDQRHGTNHYQERYGH